MRTFRRTFKGGMAFEGQEAAFMSFYELLGMSFYELLQAVLFMSFCMSFYGTAFRTSRPFQHGEGFYRKAGFCRQLLQAFGMAGFCTAQLLAGRLLGQARF